MILKIKVRELHKLRANLQSVIKFSKRAAAKESIRSNFHPKKSNRLRFTRRLFLFPKGLFDQKLKTASIKWNATSISRQVEQKLKRVL
jgi:hypothetical protein